jgi:solute carrier family 25 phosphate transporter 23/24/25/41
MTATGLCFPLDVLRTRIMGPGALPGAGVLTTLRTMVAVEGPASLYVGLAPALAATAPAGAVFYGTYDVVREAYLRATFDARAAPRPPRLAAVQTLAFGAIAGCAAELSIYPAEIVRRRMQLASMARARALAAAAAAGGEALAAATAAATPALTFRGAAAALLRERGVKGMYAGLGPNMLQVLPSAALSYWAYEVFKGLLSVE